jgi:hypothetical protein
MNDALFDLGDTYLVIDWLPARALSHAEVRLRSPTWQATTLFVPVNANPAIPIDRT